MPWPRWPCRKPCATRAYIENYVAEVLAAQELLCVGLEKLGISYVPSSAKFCAGEPSAGEPSKSATRCGTAAFWCATEAMKSPATSA
jgi:hypothetical protein